MRADLLDFFHFQNSPGTEHDCTLSTKLLFRSVRGFGRSRGQLEHRSTTMSTAVLGGTVKISVRIL
jgi:hypothetical protein